MPGLRQRADRVQQACDTGEMQRVRSYLDQAHGWEGSRQGPDARRGPVMPQRAEFPDIGDLVVCSVTNVKNFGAFVTLDEFGGKEGFIHVRDVATGWVKYIRDHVREGQKIVCKVLGVDKERGHIDLSLKQVNDHQRREQIQEWKNEKKADKLLEIAGTKLGKTLDQAFTDIGDKLID